MRQHYGMPGPGGSMGKCAVCGNDFAADVIKSLAGAKSGIVQFEVGFADQILFAHTPCLEILKESFADTQEPEVVRDRLPTGPLKEALSTAIEMRAFKHGESEVQS